MPHSAAPADDHEGIRWQTNPAVRSSADVELSPFYGTPKSHSTAYSSSSSSSSCQSHRWVKFFLISFLVLSIIVLTFALLAGFSSFDVLKKLRGDSHHSSSASAPASAPPAPAISISSAQVYSSGVNLAMSIAYAIDDNPSTYYEDPQPGSFIGFNFTRAYEIVQVRIFPHPGYLNALIGSKIVGSTDSACSFSGSAAVTLHTINSAPTAGDYNVYAILNPQSNIFCLRLVSSSSVSGIGTRLADVKIFGDSFVSSTASAAPPLASSTGSSSSTAGAALRSSSFSSSARVFVPPSFSSTGLPQRPLNSSLITQITAYRWAAPAGLVRVLANIPLLPGSVFPRDVANVSVWDLSGAGEVQVSAHVKDTGARHYGTAFPSSLLNIRIELDVNYAAGEVSRDFSVRFSPLAAVLPRLSRTSDVEYSNSLVIGLSADRRQFRLMNTFYLIHWDEAGIRPIAPHDIAWPAGETDVVASSNIQRVVYGLFVAKGEQTLRMERQYVVSLTAVDDSDQGISSYTANQAVGTIRVQLLANSGMTFSPSATLLDSGWLQCSRYNSTGSLVHSFLSPTFVMPAFVHSAFLTPTDPNYLSKTWPFGFAMQTRAEVEAWGVGPLADFSTIEAKQDAPFNRWWKNYGSKLIYMAGGGTIYSYAFIRYMRFCRMGVSALNMLPQALGTWIEWREFGQSLAQYSEDRLPYNFGGSMETRGKSLLYL
jgi:hypothetical protein